MNLKIVKKKFKQQTIWEWMKFNNHKKIVIYMIIKNKKKKKMELEILYSVNTDFEIKRI